MRKAANKVAIPRPFRPSGRGAGQDRGPGPAPSRPRRHVQGRVAVEEAVGLKPEAGAGDRLHRPVLEARQVQQAECVPQHDIRILYRPALLDPGGDGLRAVALVDEAPGRIAFAGVVGVHQRWLKMKAARLAIMVPAWNQGLSMPVACNR